MLRHVKRACMGKSTCDVSVLCKNRRDNARAVFYYCVQDSAVSKTCKGSAVIVSEPHGFLQNPDYPAASPYRACHWRIEPQSRDAVHLRLFDLASVHRSEGRCDGGLHVTAQKCGWSRQTFTELLCADGETRSSSSSSQSQGSQDRRNSRAGAGGGGGGERGREGERAEGGGEGRGWREVTLVSCGPVDVRLTPARHAYPLRFWLSYSVTSSVRSADVGRSLAEAGLLVQCPVSPGSGSSSASGGGRFDPHQGGIPPAVTPLTTARTMTTNHSMTSASGASGDGAGASGDQDNTMTVLIVLVCVIGFIALVLSVVLIIVCLRRRRPKVELIEHVYAVPSTCQTLSHTYLGDDPPPEPVPRPRLVQAYSDVADARPPNQPPQVTPASPAYAEVEEIVDADADDKTRKRFHFRFRKRPSVSSTGGSSSLYEDVNPLPVNNASGSKSNTVAPKNNTLPKYSGVKLNSAPGGPYSTGVKKGGKRGGGIDSPKTIRESPVYVHVVDNADVNSETSSSKSSTEKRPVAPLAAKFIANIDKSATAKVGPRGKTDASTRLYPLQQGRVANLVSTLNRKKDTTNGVTAKEEGGEVS
ncbi:hypothetical protein ACOMHN_030926 [Nucella lapillus]